jgi:hypothetical protein
MRFQIHKLKKERKQVVITEQTRDGFCTATQKAGGMT